MSTEVAEPTLLMLNTGRGTQQVCDYQQARRLLTAARADRDNARTRITELEDWQRRAEVALEAMHGAHLCPRAFVRQLLSEVKPSTLPVNVRKCDNCKHESSPGDVYPCLGCASTRDRTGVYSRWQPLPQPPEAE